MTLRHSRVGENPVPPDFLYCEYDEYF
jgi:hypothetical protein